MLIELIKEVQLTFLNTSIDIAEGFMLACVGVKVSRRTKTARHRTYQHRQYPPVVYRPAAPRLYVVKKAV